MNYNNEITISNMGHTWILDLDGTMVKHNGYLVDGHDTFLNGAKEFLDSIPKDDLVIIVTSRKEEYRSSTLEFLNKENVRYNQIFFGAPYGERILLNDNKPSGLVMSVACTQERDIFDLHYSIDENL